MSRTDRTDKRAAGAAQDARDWREAGHTRLAWIQQGNPRLTSGFNEDLAVMIEAAESGGWALDMITAGPQGTILIFCADPPGLTA